MNSQDEIVDKNKLTQRELLIRLSDQMENVRDDLRDLKKETSELRLRVAKIETRMVVVSGAFGVGSVILTLIINFFKLIK
ncbi:MAG: hypothetical protein IMY72_11765 [Bacteroidetes bacterium]|nr:hypothetical protein [Bacteroidota bacterium]